MAMSGTEKKQEGLDIEPADDSVELDADDILKYLMDELQEPSQPEEKDPSAHDDQENDASQFHEYVLPASALKEKRTLEELAEMATGTFKYEPPEETSNDNPEDYFHHTRKLKALQTN